MNLEESRKQIFDAVEKAMKKLKLEKGEHCPFCGRKRGQRNVSEKMLKANRINSQKAREKYRKQQKIT